MTVQTSTYQLHHGQLGQAAAPYRLTALTTIQDIMVGMKKTITQLDWRVSATDPDAVEMRFLPIDVGNNAAITAYNYPATSGPMVTEDLDGVETTVWTVAIDGYWTGPLSYTNCV